MGSLQLPGAAQDRQPCACLFACSPACTFPSTHATGFTHPCPGQPQTPFSALLPLLSLPGCFHNTKKEVKSKLQHNAPVPAGCGHEIPPAAACLSSRPRPHSLVKALLLLLQLPPFLQVRSSEQTLRGPWGEESPLPAVSHVPPSG